MKAISLLALTIAALFLLSGCTGPDGSEQVTSMVKALPEVQAFLEKNPDATIKVVYWGADTATENIESVREKCGSQMKVQEYWYVSVEKGEQKIFVWLDKETEQLLCLVKEGAELVEDECGTDSDSECITEKTVIVKDADTGKVLDGLFAYLDLYCSNEKGPVMSKRGDNGTFDFAVTQKCGQISVTVSADGFKTKTVNITQSTTIIYLEHAAGECDDTDNGEDYYIKGETLNTEFHCEDSCQYPDKKGYMLFECVCDATTAKGAVAKPYVCPHGACIDGLCTDKPVERTCTAKCEKSAPVDKFKKDYLILTRENCGQEIVYDECKNETVLLERKCTVADAFESEEIECAYKCADGACIEKTGQQLECGCPDVTFDGKVDIADLAFVGQKVGTQDALADIDMDSKVTQLDLDCVKELYDQQTNCAGMKKLEKYACDEADVIKNGKIDIFELALMGLQINKKQGDSDFNADADITKDGWVNNIDFAIISSNFGEGCYKCPDIDKDGKVNIFDLAAIGLAHGSREGDPNWNKKADLFEDGIINEKDLAVEGEYNGESTKGIEICKGICTDSDKGKNYYAKGETTNVQSGNRFFETWADVCLKDNQTPLAGQENMLFEGYCDEQDIGRITDGPTAYNCPGACEDGICIEKITIELKKGRNFFSIPFILSDSNIDVVLAPIKGKYASVWTSENGALVSSTQPFNPLTEIDHLHGYDINMLEDGALTLQGKRITTAVTIRLAKEWNYLGFPKLSKAKISDVLSGLNYSNMYYTKGGIEYSTMNNTLEYMEPGKGYMIYLNEPGEVTFNPE